MSFETHFEEFSLIFLKGNGFMLSSLVLLICGLPVLYFLRRRRWNLPPGPIGLPLVGYLPFLGKEPFRTLDTIGKKYGNIFSLYMGPKYVVILGDYTAVKEAFSRPETVHRPEGIFDFQPDGFGIAEFSGAKWVEQRRTVTKQTKDLILSRSTWEQLVQDEVLDFRQVIANTEGAPTSIEKYLTSSISKNIASFVFGNPLPPGPDRDMLNSSLNAITTFFSQAGLWNYFPWLCKMMVKLKIGTYYKMFSEMADLNTFVRKEIEMHKKAPDNFKRTDFVTSYMEAIKDRANDTDTHFNEKSLIGNVQALFVGGSETITTSVMWLILAMTAYPNVQQNVHKELDSVLGEEQKPSWERRVELPYTYAVVMEGQRWKTVAPFALAHIASKDFKLSGYNVPKGSMLFANVWALHNDTRYWKDPEDFIPERFLQNEGKSVNLKVESYAPFSLGKRRCPGETVAMIEIFLYFTSIMQRYKVRAPNDGKPNLNAVLGATYMPLEQDLCFLSR